MHPNQNSTATLGSANGNGLEAELSVSQANQEWGIVLILSFWQMFIHARISSNIYCVTDMTNDLKNRQILHSDTEFTEWQYILISLQNKCLIQPQIQRFCLHLNRCLQTSSIPLLAFARFPSFPPKFFPSRHEDITPLIWLEALNNNFLFFNSIYHYFWFSPISPSDFSLFLPRFNHHDFLQH